jgi:hypothetical protein
MYWFGQYIPEKSQKQLWMIANSSIQHMQKIDAEITQHFHSLLLRLTLDEDMRNAWMTGEMTSKDFTSGETVRCWCSCWNGSIAAIIVLDQMSRHMHRHFSNQIAGGAKTEGCLNGIRERDHDTVLPRQRDLDELAFHIACRFQRRYEKQIRCGMIPIPMMIFALMPLRHKSTLRSVGFVQCKIEEIASLHSVDFENMIRRFRRATNRRLAVLQDEGWNVCLFNTMQIIGVAWRGNVKLPRHTADANTPRIFQPHLHRFL